MELTVSTNRREDIVDITSQVKKMVEDSGIGEGLCNLHVLHTTAAITINENDDPNVGTALLQVLKELVPQWRWKHDPVDGNGDAHIKASLIGANQTIPIKDGKLVLGRWQDIFLCDFDGPRKRKIIITITETKV